MTDEPANPPDRKRGKVVALTRPDAPVVQDVIETLDELLTMARKGEITELICVYANHGGEVGHMQTDISFVISILGGLRVVGDALSEAYREDD